MRQSNAFLGILILVAMPILIIYAIAALSPVHPDKGTDGANGPELTPLARPTVTFGNPSIGLREAPVTIIEFGDYLCQPCAAIHGTLAQIVADYPNDVRLVWKDMPNVKLHGEAANAAVAARCAGDQGAFWEYHKTLMENQTSISLNNYAIFAAQLGLDAESFQSCFDAQQTLPLVERDLEEGIRLRIDATPYLFIGERRLSGAVDYNQLKALVESAKAAATVEKTP